MPHLKQGSKPYLLGWVCSGKVALSGGMLDVGSVVAVAVHSIGSSAVMVASFEHWVSATKVVAVASRIEDTALHWHLRPIHLWWLEELVKLRERGRRAVRARGAHHLL
jgi:hypothetical protein